MIAVDWVYGSTAAYFSAVENVIKLGLEISRFLRKLLVGVEELRVSSGCLWGSEHSERKKEHVRRSFREEAEPLVVCGSLIQVSPLPLTVLTSGGVLNLCEPLAAPL